MSTYTYTGLSEGTKAAVAQANMLNEGCDLVPTIASANANAVRDAILAEVAASLSGSGSDNFTSASGYIALGASPPAIGAIRVDAGSYSNVVAQFSNGSTTAIGGFTVAAGLFRVQALSSAALILQANAISKWSIDANSAGTAQFTSQEATARIIGGATNGLAIRNSGNTRDNFRVYDDGSIAHLQGATYGVQLANFGAGGEQGAGGVIRGVGGGLAIVPDNGPTAGLKAQVCYYNGTQYYSALEVANVASGFGTLNLMKSGGQVAIGTASGTACLDVATSRTASGGLARGFRSVNTLVAAANNDALTQNFLGGSFTPGAFTGIIARGLQLANVSVATFTTPGDPAALYISAVNGTGATNGYAIQLEPPTGATNNYLIAHTTPATFNVTSTGSLSVAAAGTLGFSARSYLDSPVDGHLKMTNAAGTAFSSLYYGQEGGPTTSKRIQKAIASMADATFTDMFTVTVPNGAHSARVRVQLAGSKGAGDAEGANGSTSVITYDIAITRTSGVATVATVSTAYGSAVATIGAANAVATTLQVSAMSGAVGATQTFTIQAKVTRGAGASTNHTCVGILEILNANATGVSIL
jgi:hypothetical protein